MSSSTWIRIRIPNTDRDRPETIILSIKTLKIGILSAGLHIDCRQLSQRVPDGGVGCEVKVLFEISLYQQVAHYQLYVLLG